MPVFNDPIRHTRTLRPYWAAVLPGLALLALVGWFVADAGAVLAQSPRVFIPTVYSNPPPQLQVSRAPGPTLGVHHSCMLTAGGAVRCWGSNFYSQLGDLTQIDRLTPVSARGLESNTARLSAGAFHTCAVTMNGGVYCWGRNNFGQLGDATNIQRPVPVAVTGLAQGAVNVSAGQFHSCALTNAGAVQCWGENKWGQLGDGANLDRNAPVVVGGLSGVRALAAGRRHTCALTGSGTVQCWGDNAYGQLGTGDNVSSASPVFVADLVDAVAIYAGEDHTCARTQAGALHCWGINTYGQLGDGSMANRNRPVTPVGLGSDVIAAATGRDHTCASTATDLRCWGYNDYGQLGNNSRSTRLTPTVVGGIPGGAASVGAGFGHSCVAPPGMGLRCWGWNRNGQIGDGTQTDRLTPVAVSGL